MSDRYTVGVDLGAGPDFERVVIVDHPGRVAIVCDRDEARRLAHALLDAIGERSEAEARAEKAERSYRDLLGEWKEDMNRIHRTEVALYRGGFGPLVHGRSPIDEWASAAVRQRDHVAARLAEAEAIVRDLADADPYVTVRPNGGIHAATRCGICLTTEGAHSLTCPYLRARAFVAREGREETDHG